MAITDERVSRRRLLKRAGVGAAVLGAGSLVTSATASAATQATICAELSYDFDSPACGACSYQQGCGDGCGCVSGTDGCCFCHQGISCTGAKRCKHNSECPPGWKCAYTCCFDGVPICVPPCYHMGVAPNGVNAKLQPGNSSTPVGR